MKLLVYPIGCNRVRTTRIIEVKTISSTVKAFTFKDRLCSKAHPGQFIMLWIPGVDEIPLSILDADVEKAQFSVAVKKVGEATEALHQRKAGDFIGVRGPYGNHFSTISGKALIVGGGIGVAPLFFLAKKLREKASKTVFIAGAKTKDELLFIEELEKTCPDTQLNVATEDGSLGFKGLASELSQRLLAKESFEMIYTCGPEKMIQEIFSQAERSKTLLEASLERLMRCAIGLCGSCVIGRYRVCRDGPIFNAERLRTLKDELGTWKRDYHGRKVAI
jgi:dihydroorotate dehydrogenase electron transfer subunit